MTQFTLNPKINVANLIASIQAEVVTDTAMEFTSAADRVCGSVPLEVCSRFCALLLEYADIFSQSPTMSALRTAKTSLFTLLDRYRSTLPTTAHRSGTESGWKRSSTTLWQQESSNAPPAPTTAPLWQFPRSWTHRIWGRLTKARACT